MPRFYSEEREEFAEFDIAETRKCAQKAALQFIYSNIKYPPEARESGIEGTVVIKYTVGRDGSIQETEIARDIGGGCGEEALRVIEMMPDWLPAYQRGRYLPVKMNMPIKFGLDKTSHLKKGGSN